jgi:hypothetical protein
MINHLHISHQYFDFNNFNTKLLNKKNLDKVLKNLDINNYHTSLEDLHFNDEDFKSNLDNLLSQCEYIYIHDISWDKINSELIINPLAYLELIHLLVTKYQHKSSGANILCQDLYYHATYLREKRLNNKPVLWVTGDSISCGQSVEINERWGNRVAKSLDLPEINIAYPGNSIFGAADAILRSDVQPDDYITWGLTSFDRVDCIRERFEAPNYAQTIGKLHNLTNEQLSYLVAQGNDEHQIDDEYNFNLSGLPYSLYLEYCKLPNNDQYFTPAWIESNTKNLIALRQIQQVINFCKKCKANLYIISFLDYYHLADLTFDKQILNLSMDEGIDFIDVGRDGMHPGPKQHKIYANKILKYISNE